MPKKTDCLCVGDLYVDILIKIQEPPRFGQVEQMAEDVHMALGGSGCIFAAQFAKLGGSCGVIGKVGTDESSALIVRALADAGVDVSRIAEREGTRVGYGILLNHGDDRAMYAYAGDSDGFGEETLGPDLAHQCSHWHIASYYLLQSLKSRWPGWIRNLRTRGVTVSLDTNYDPDERWADARELLPLIDVFLPNETEACAIAGTDSAEAAGKKLAAECPLVVIKKGSHGAAAFKGDRQWSMAVPDDLRDGLAIIDTVGAGDSFDGGFLRAWTLGKSVDECLRWGIRCGCASLRGPGGTAAQWKETMV